MSVSPVRNFFPKRFDVRLWSFLLSSSIFSSCFFGDARELRAFNRSYKHSFVTVSFWTISISFERAPIHIPSEHISLL